MRLVELIIVWTVWSIGLEDDTLRTILIGAFIEVTFHTSTAKPLESVIVQFNSN